jgi:hypothetical protein
LGITVEGVLKEDLPFLGREVILDGSNVSLFEISSQVKEQLGKERPQPKSCDLKLGQQDTLVGQRLADGLVGVDVDGLGEIQHGQCDNTLKGSTLGPFKDQHSVGKISGDGASSGVKIKLLGSDVGQKDLREHVPKVIVKPQTKEIVDLSVGVTNMVIEVENAIVRQSTRRWKRRAGG